LLVRVRVRLTAWSVETQTQVVVLVPVMESNGGAVVGPGVTVPVPVVGLGVTTPAPVVTLGVTVPVPVVGLGVTIPVPVVTLGVTVSAPEVGLGVTVSAPEVGLGVMVPCHSRLWFSRAACATLGDRACTDMRMLATTSSSAGELRTNRARIGFLSLPFQPGSAITRTESGGARFCSDQLSTPGAA
jgi:hypothetical protein